MDFLPGAIQSFLDLYHNIQPKIAWQNGLYRYSNPRRPRSYALTVAFHALNYDITSFARLFSVGYWGMNQENTISRPGQETQPIISVGFLVRGEK